MRQSSIKKKVFVPILKSVSWSFWHFSSSVKSIVQRGDAGAAENTEGNKLDRIDKISRLYSFEAQNGSIPGKAFSILSILLILSKSFPCIFPSLTVIKISRLCSFEGQTAAFPAKHPPCGLLGIIFFKNVLDKAPQIYSYSRDNSRKGFYAYSTQLLLLLLF